jgi:hypothetical protein
MKSLQETYAPANECFGCGPANPKGLQIRSFEQGDEVVAEWTPQKHHEAFPGVLNGGIIGALLDCHCNWAAIMHFKKAKGMTVEATLEADGKIRATCKGTFVAVEPGHPAYHRW